MFHISGFNVSLMPALIYVSVTINMSLKKIFQALQVITILNFKDLHHLVQMNYWVSFSFLKFFVDGLLSSIEFGSMLHLLEMSPSFCKNNLSFCMISTIVYNLLFHWIELSFEHSTLMSLFYN